MLKEKVSGESEGEYGSLIKEFKEVNIKEWFSIFSSISSLIIKMEEKKSSVFFQLFFKSLTISQLSVHICDP